MLWTRKFEIEKWPEYEPLAAAIAAHFVDICGVRKQEIADLRFTHEKNAEKRITSMAQIDACHPSRAIEYPWALEACPPKGTVLDIGTDYRWAFYLAGIDEVNRLTIHHTYQDIDVIGCRINSETHMTIDCSKAFRAYQDKLTMIYGIPDQLPITHETYDIIYCLSVLEHVETDIDLARWIYPMLRWLKPGGKLCITVDWLVGLPFGGQHSLNWPIWNRDFRTYFDLSCLDQKPWEPLDGNDEIRFMKTPTEAITVYGFIVEKPC